MRSHVVAFIALLSLAVAACAEAPASPPPPPPGATTPPTTAPVPSAAEAVEPVGKVLELQHESQVRFVIFQFFRGEPNFVEGINPRVSGEVVVTDDGISIGEVVVRADTFKTEKNKPPNPLGDEVGWRDEAIDRYILEVADHPTITFVPTGAPELLADGTYRPVAGDLTIRGITRAVTFFVAISPAGDDTYAVDGFANVLRSDFGLTLPTVRHVTEVAEEVSLEFEFVYGPSNTSGG